MTSIKETLLQHIYAGKTVKDTIDAVKRPQKYFNSVALFDEQNQSLNVDFGNPELPFEKFYRLTNRYDIGENEGTEYLYEWFYRMKNYHDGRVCLGSLRFLQPELSRYTLDGLKLSDYNVDALLLSSPVYTRYAQVHQNPFNTTQSVAVTPMRLDLIS